MPGDWSLSTAYLLIRIINIIIDNKTIIIRYLNIYKPPCQQVPALLALAAVHDLHGGHPHTEPVLTFYYYIIIIIGIVIIVIIQ